MKRDRNGVGDGRPEGRPEEEPITRPSTCTVRVGMQGRYRRAWSYREGQGGKAGWRSSCTPETFFWQNLGGSIGTSIKGDNVRIRKN